MIQRRILLSGAVCGATAVLLGAFGAHWLEGAVVRWDLPLEEQAKRLDVWEVAVRYQMYHALALLMLGLLTSPQNRNAANWSARLFLVGILIFSGCLYVLVLSGVKVLGAIVPVGGVSLVVGWIMLAVAAWQRRE